MPSDSNTRFSDRVADYVRTRPGYPTAVLDILGTETGLNPATVVADVGAGTGLSAELFLRNGNTVFGVEPNREMREAAESLLAGYANFHSVAGSAESTTLPDASVDLIVAGQAFHWFDVPRARAEFRRILRPDGVVVLMWNTRRLDTTPFLRLRGVAATVRDRLSRSRAHQRRPRGPECVLRPGRVPIVQAR